MADLFETTVVDPSIPPGDILPIELMLLAEIFTLDGDNDRIYLHTENETAQICAHRKAPLAQNWKRFNSIRKTAKLAANGMTGCQSMTD